MKIVLAGGGSGGHVFPLIAVAREIKRLMPEEAKLVYIGPKDEWTTLYLPQEDIQIKPILVGKIRRYLTLKSVLLNILDLFKCFLGFFQSLFILLFQNPDLVFSKGGYASLPVIFAAKLLRIPIFLHESDITPGLANKIAGRLALEIFISFPKTEYFDPEKTVLVGNPIRREVFGGTKEKSKELLKISGQRYVILVIGGSQGAQRINDLVLLVLPELLKEYEIIHQCGRKNFDQVSHEAKVVVPKQLEKYYHLFPFLNEIQLREAYFSADLIISRAGGIVFEITAHGKPSILIPLPESAQNHQVKNAYALAEKGAAVVIEETNLTPKFFVDRVKAILNNKKELEKMKKAAQRFSKPMAAKSIAHYLLQYVLT
jgi:UDP-N-acetylglucosamine--N-acetylmuramyl-(pentapeptide) pyrophosphoryl-undecaprenol N-acetylglucosamine transferase